MVDTDGKITYSYGTPIPDLRHVGYGHKKRGSAESQST